MSCQSTLNQENSEMDFNSNNMINEEILYDADEFENLNGKNYNGVIDSYFSINKAIMSIFFNYFNILSYRKRNGKDIVNNNIDIEFNALLDVNNRYVSLLPEALPTTCTFSAIIKYKGVDILLVFNAFKDGGEIRSVIRMSSISVLLDRGEEVYKALFHEAINLSNVRGSYFTIKDNELNWSIGKLDKITFDDIYLPDEKMLELRLYVDLFEKRSLLQRYMFSGVPGSGKTESTRAISWLLNQKGVTIMKTNICDIIDDKFELAEILGPCLIILDDLDLYLGDRNSNSVSFRLGKFLNLLDGVDKLSDNIGVIATTNAPHLIDLAAQRPGRFNKLMFFDDLTLGNIKDIILKSLSAMHAKFKNVSDEERVILTDDNLIKFFKDDGSTGAFIYETMKNIKNKIDVLGGKLEIDTLIKEMEKDNKILKKSLNANKIEDKFSGHKKKFGY